jgi:hypothetical protein
MIPAAPRRPAARPGDRLSVATLVARRPAFVLGRPAPPTSRTIPAAGTSWPSGMTSARAPSESRRLVPVVREAREELGLFS